MTMARKTPVSFAMPSILSRVNTPWLEVMRQWKQCSYVNFLDYIQKVLPPHLQQKLIAVVLLMVKYKRSLKLILIVSALCGISKQILLPWLIQRLINQSEMNILEMRLHSPNSKGLKSQMKLQVISNSPIASFMESKSPFQLFHEGLPTAVAQIEGPFQIPRRGGIIHIDVSLTLIKGYEKNFEFLCRDLVTSSSSVTFTLSGKTVTLLPVQNIPSLQLPGFSLNKSMKVKGMGGLKSMQIQSVELRDSTLDHLLLSCTCMVTNPSFLTLALGDLEFTISSSELPDVELAVVKLVDVNIKPGENTMLASCEMQRPQANTSQMGAREQTIRLLSRYLTGKSTSIIVQGRKGSEKYLNTALNAIRIQTILPPLNSPPLVEKGWMSLSSVRMGLQQSTASTHLTFCNPFPVGLTITRICGTAYVSEELETPDSQERTCLGKLNAQVLLFIPPNSTLQAEELVPMILKLGPRQISSVIGGAGKLLVDMETEIDCRVGLCVISNIPYSQSNLPIQISL
jgi:hypothetical protein